MNKKLIIWIFGILFISLPSFSFTQKASITFQNKTYAGESLFVLKERDFISKIIDTIATIKPNNSGLATIDIPCKEPYFIILQLFKQQAWFCIEPNKKYTLLLPNKLYLTIEDSLNAYFKPFEFFATTIPYDSSITQNAIVELNFAIDTLIEKHLKTIRYKIKRKTVDSLLNKLEQSFAYCKTPYFQQYLFYKIAWLKQFSYERDANYIIKNYFSEKPVLLNNLAYIELFNEIFYDYLSRYATTKWGENVFSSIAKAKSPTELRKDLRRNPAFTNDTLIDLVILKGLHDAYFTNTLPNKIKFPVEQLKMTLDSMAIVACTPDLRNMAKNIKQKISEEEKIFIFEEYPLFDLNGTEYFLRNFTGKFLYVNICDFRSYSFLIDQKKIKAIFSRFSDKLRVIHIVLYPQKDKLQKLIRDEQLIGTFLTTPKPEELKKLLRKPTIPHYIMYAPNGKVFNPNAPPPEENLIPYFIDLLK